ncbi:MAG: hypothetical protein GWO26_26035, partial [Phycisphaerae bacterium]|nr:hypothetical protein [Phycisphaerae bacterium]
MFRRIELGNDKRDFTYIRRTPLERAKLAGEQVAKDVRGLVSEEIPTRRAIGRQEQELVRSRGAPVKLLPLKSKPGERLSNPQKEYNKIVREVNKAIEQRDVKKIETVSKKLDEVQLPKAQLTPTEQRKVENLRRTLKEIPQFAPASGKFERPIQEFITVQGKIVRKTPETEAQRVRELEAEIEASIQERLQRPSIASPTIISERLTAEGRETALFQPEYGSFFYGLPPVQTVTTDIEATTLTPFKYVESSLIPAKTLQEDVYLPDQQAIDRYTKLIDESNILKGGFKGGELNVFLREQQAELQRDIGVFNTRKSEATAIIDNSRYRQLENRIKNNRATAEEVTEYNTLYKEYESKFNEAERLRSQILKGYKGTGWELLKDTSDQIKQRTSGRVDPTLARGLLRAGVAAYDVEKKVLAAQVGGTLLGATPIGSYATNALRTPLGIIGSKPVVFGAGGVSGATVGISEFAQSGDLPYAIGAGLGTTGGFLGSVYSRQIVETGGQGVRGLREFLTRDIGKAGKTQLSYINGGVAESKLAKEQLKKYKYTKKDAQNLRANISKLSRDRQVLEFRKIYNTVKNDPVKLKQFLRYAKLVFSKQVITTGMTPEPTQRVILTGPTTATKQSLFTGQGLYERTTGFQSPLSLDTTTTTATKSFIGGQSVSNQQNLVRGSDLFALIRQ